MIIQCYSLGKSSFCSVEFCDGVVVGFSGSVSDLVVGWAIDSSVLDAPLTFLSSSNGGAENNDGAVNSISVAGIEIDIVETSE